jgi:carbamoyl-phosphate synthase large subunit
MRDHNLLVLSVKGIEVILDKFESCNNYDRPFYGDHIYLKPTTKSIIEILKAHPQIDAVLPTMGGQTALNLCLEADEKEFGKIWSKNDRC